MYLFTTHSIGDTVYYVENESTVFRAKVESIRVSRTEDGKDEVEYTVRDFNGNLDFVEQDNAFRSADSAFYSLDKPIEAEPVAVDSEGHTLPAGDGVATGGTLAHSEDFF